MGEYALKDSGVCSVCDITALNTQALRSDPAAHRIDQSGSGKIGPSRLFWASATRGARDARRLSTPPPPAEDQANCDSYKRPVLSRAHATETRHSIVRPRAEGDAGVAVTRVSTHHTEAIRSRCHLIYRTACPVHVALVGR